MKNAIKLAAVLLLASASVFAATPAKSVVPFSDGEITLSSLPSLKGLDVKVEKSLPGKATVIIYNQDNTVIFKDALGASKAMEKGYILTQLESGDYTMEVFSGKQSIKKQIHVYEADGVKSFFVKQ